MKDIKITYTVDNNSWSDEKFEDEPERVLVITFDKIVELIGNSLKEGEFIGEICDIRLVG